VRRHGDAKGGSAKSQHSESMTMWILRVSLCPLGLPTAASSRRLLVLVLIEICRRRACPLTIGDRGITAASVILRRRRKAFIFVPSKAPHHEKPVFSPSQTCSGAQNSADSIHVNCGRKLAAARTAHP
jgi:hypothetical protein